MNLDELRIIYEYLRASSPGQVLLDVGAFRGKHLRPFLKDGWRVFAFEPDPAKYDDLRQLAASYPGLSIHPLAVTDRTAAAVAFFTSALSEGISGLHPFHASHREAFQVATTSLGDFAREHALTGIDFLKIDAEGADAAVLRGIPWDRLRPHVIMCEFDEAKRVDASCRYAALGAYLSERGYAVLVSEWQPIADYGQPHAWARFALYPDPLQDPAGWGNLIAFRDGLDWPRWANAVARVDGLHLTRTTRHNNRLEQNVKRLEQVIEGQKDDRRGMIASRSWRWTAWLRLLLSPLSPR